MAGSLYLLIPLSCVVSPPPPPRCCGNHQTPSDSAYSVKGISCAALHARPFGPSCLWPRVTPESRLSLPRPLSGEPERPGQVPGEP